MDNLSDSIRGELDSVTSTDSLQLITDEFQLRHISTPDVSNIELSKRVALLELENERLRVDLENARIDLNARIAANQGLKGKVTELYVEVQSVLQKKQKLQNALSDATSRLSSAESSAKWYQAQLHNFQADRKALQVEVETYQGILRQKQQTITSVTARYKQLDVEYGKMGRELQKCQREKQELLERMQERLCRCCLESKEIPQKDTEFSAPDLSLRLESTENELRNTKAELKVMEERLLGSEIANASMKNVISKQQVLIASMEENAEHCESGRLETAEKLRATQLEVQKLRSDNDTLQSNLLSSRTEQSQIEDAILQLRTQLTKMIAQYKLLKSRNAEAEERLTSMQEILLENKRLKSLSYDANVSLVRRLKQEKKKVKFLEKKLQEARQKVKLEEMKIETDSSLRGCLRQALLRNKEQLKFLTKSSDESIDEGYGDSSIVNSVSAELPSASPLNPKLLEEAYDVLLRSKDLLAPVHLELDELQLKIEKLQSQYVPSRQ